MFSPSELLLTGCFMSRLLGVKISSLYINNESSESLRSHCELTEDPHLHLSDRDSLIGQLQERPSVCVPLYLYKFTFLGFFFHVS